MHAGQALLGASGLLLPGSAVWTQHRGFSSTVSLTHSAASSLGPITPQSRPCGPSLPDYSVADCTQHGTLLRLSSWYMALHTWRSGGVFLQ